MRKYFLTTLLLALTLALQAQDKKGFNYTEFGHYRTPNSSYSSTSLRTMFGSYLTPQTTLALGIGLDGYSSGPFHINSAPVFLDARYFFKDKANTPFATTNIGYAVNLGRQFNTGVVIGLGAGYRFKISKNNKLSTALRYNVFSVDKTNGFSVQTLGINLGWYL